MAICTVDSPFFVPSVSCDLVRSPTRSHETEGTKKGESTSLRSSSPMVTLSLGLEPAGCTNEAYIVRLDSMCACIGILGEFTSGGEGASEYRRHAARVATYESKLNH